MASRPGPKGRVTVAGGKPAGMCLAEECARPRAQQHPHWDASETDRKPSTPPVAAPVAAPGDGRTPLNRHACSGPPTGYHHCPFGTVTETVWASKLRSVSVRLCGSE